MTLLMKTAKTDRWTSGVARETLTNAMQEKESDSDCESLWKKMIGKPYSGKLNVRFDEGELEIEHG